MHPFLFDLTIGGFHFKPPTYGILLALAFTVAYIYSLRRAVKLGEDPKHIENCFLVVVICTVVGARLFHVIFEEPKYYFTHPLKIFAVWEGGYTLYGALLMSIFGIFIYSRWQKISFLQIGDIAAPAAALGIAIGRMGCFFAGCCWGKPANLPWAVVFNHPLAFTNLKHIPIHPTQLYEALTALMLGIYLNSKFKNRKFKGQILSHGLIGYTVIRFFIEFFRGDEYRGFVFNGLLSYSQFISLIILPFSILLLIVCRSK